MPDEIVQQNAGYAIIEKPEMAFNSYEASEFIEKNRHTWDKLRQALHFLNPIKYRGHGRHILMPYPTLDPKMIDMWERDGGIDMHTNAAARRRFLEIIGEDTPMGDYDENLLATEDQAKEIHALLDSPDDFEILYLRRREVAMSDRTCGFDIGWWTNYSIISDSIVMPFWHAPAENSFSELAKQASKLNAHLLFDSVANAEAFRAWYRTQPWAEDYGLAEDSFWIIQVDEVL